MSLYFVTGFRTPENNFFVHLREVSRFCNFQPMIILRCFLFFSQREHQRPGTFLYSEYQRSSFVTSEESLENPNFSVRQESESVNFPVTRAVGNLHFPPMRAWRENELSYQWNPWEAALFHHAGVWTFFSGVYVPSTNENTQETVLSTIGACFFL